MSRRRRFLILSGLLAAACLVALWVAFYKDIAVAYHRRRMVSAWNGVREVGPRSMKQSEYLEAYEHHRDMLVKLGFLERGVFPLRHVPTSSPQWRRFHEAVERAFPNHVPVAELPAGAMVVWDRPERMAAWEAVIREYDRQTPSEAGAVRPG